MSAALRRPPGLASGRARGSALMLALACVACAEPRRAQTVPREAVASRVDVFLRALGADSGDLGFHLAGAWLRDQAGGRRELELATADVSSAAARRRIALAGATVEPGTYVALVLAVDAAFDESSGTRRPLQLSDALPDEPGGGPRAVEHEVPLRVVVGRHDAASVFLDWNVRASVETGTFRPSFGASLETPQVRLALLYVVDARSGSVLALDRSSGQVVATGKVGTRPVALAASRDRRLLFVANAGDGSVSLVDLRQNFAEFTIPVRLSAGTSDVVVAEEESLLAVTNPGLDTVSLLDVRSAARVADVRVGRRPIRLEAVPDHRRLFVVNSLSDDLSVIDIGSRSVIAVLPLESTPTAVVAGRRGREVFVGHRASPNLLVLDAGSLARADSIFVGGEVTALLADRRRDRVYVAREHPAEIAVVDRRLAAVTRRIPISGRVEFLAQPLDGPFIYGAAPELGGLIVVNVILGREEPLLPCGAAPTDVVAID